MNWRKLWLSTLLIATVALAGCGGGEKPSAATSAAGATSATQPEATAVPEEPTTPPTAAPTPTAKPTSAPTESPKAEPAELIEVSGVKAQSVLDVESIDSFRISLSFRMEGEAFSENQASGTIEGAFTRKPRAHHLVIQVEGEEEQPGEFEIIQIEDQIYLQVAGQWMEAPAGAAPQLEDYYLFGDELKAEETIAGLERVGEETVNGRQTIHYRGDRAFLTTNEVGGGEFDVENAETAQYDVWIDKAEGFPVKQTVVFEGAGVNPQNPEASGRVEYVLEYYDFNADITIEAPV